MRNGFLFLAALCLPLAASAEPPQLVPVKHIVVLYLENHSFDNMFGTFPGAEGIASAKNSQVDAQGAPFVSLPAVTRAGKPDPRFPVNLPNAPFKIADYVGMDGITGDLLHRYYQHIAQIDGGKMDKFVTAGDSGGLPMGYYEEKHSPLWRYAERYTLLDHFFTAAFGGSALNHFWLICSCTPQDTAAAPALRATLDANGVLLKDGALTPDGFAVNTIQPGLPPYDPKVADSKRRLGAQTLPTIGDRLSAHGVDWAWYAGGWDDAVAGKADPSFQFHHQPFTYFANFAPDTPGRAHLKDEKAFVNAIQDGTLPPVSFYKPIGALDLHPGYSRMNDGEGHVFDLIQKIEHSALWKDTLIIVTFDDAGGFWDHVAPPKGDRFGPGTRVPTLLISPFTQGGHVEHGVYDTTSILKLIESKYDLPPLATRDADATNLAEAIH